MAIQPNDILRVAARLRVTDVGDFVNVFHYRVNNAGGFTDTQVCEELAQQVDDMYQQIKGYVPSYAAAVDINFFNVSQSVPLGSLPWPVLTGGTGGTGDMLPAQACAFVRALTGYSRSWAKKFLGPFVESFCDAHGFVASGGLTALGLFGSDWLSTVTWAAVGEAQPVVFNSKLAQWLPLIEIVVRNVFATMRTRRAGRGS
jgi:hypothetical protein